MSYRDPHTMLFDAIFSGDADKVKQLIGSGIDKNTVLHSPTRWEGASVLGTSAYEGHIEIVKYLLEVGTSVNFTDPCQGRNALHWACKGNQYQVAKYLLSYGIDVNKADKDHVTPLIQATMERNCDLVKLLLHKGADVNMKDRLRCSPLHYACILGDSNLVDILIKGGGTHNNHTVIGRGTPLASLVHSKDKNNVILLLESGYNMANESWLEQWDKSKQQTANDVVLLALDRYRNPQSLKNLCRSEIRKNMCGRNVQEKIESLNTPSSLRYFLLLKNYDNCLQNKTEIIGKTSGALNICIIYIFILVSFLFIFNYIRYL